MDTKKENLNKDQEIKKLLKNNKDRMEIAKELQSNRKIGDMVGERLAQKKHFPPC